MSESMKALRALRNELSSVDPRAELVSDYGNDVLHVRVTASQSIGISVLEEQGKELRFCVCTYCDGEFSAEIGVLAHASHVAAIVHAAAIGIFPL